MISGSGDEKKYNRPKIAYVLVLEKSHSGINKSIQLIQ